MTPTIIYIGGYGRAGSSILDCMLGAAPGVLGAGELFRLWHGNLADQCMSGERRPVEPFLEFWCEVERRVGIPRQEAERIRAAVEPYNAWDSRGQLFKDYERLMRRLFTVLAMMGYTHVVDSSKNARGARFRALHLRRCGLPVFFVHLRRGFRETMRAVHRGTNDQFLGANPDHLRLARAALGYRLAHRAADRCADGMSFVDCKTLRFEDLMARPVAQIAVICELTGIDAAPIIDRLGCLDADGVRHGQPFEVGHQIGGNRLYRAGLVRFTPPRPREPWLGDFLGDAATIAVGGPLLALVLAGAGAAHLAHKGLGHPRLRLGAHRWRMT